MTSFNLGSITPNSLRDTIASNNGYKWKKPYSNSVCDSHTPNLEMLMHLKITFTSIPWQDDDMGNSSIACQGFGDLVRHELAGDQVGGDHVGPDLVRSYWRRTVITI